MYISVDTTFCLCTCSVQEELCSRQSNLSQECTQSQRYIATSILLWSNLQFFVISAGSWKKHDLHTTIGNVRNFKKLSVDRAKGNSQIYTLTVHKLNYKLIKTTTIDSGRSLQSLSTCNLTCIAIVLYCHCLCEQYYLYSTYSSRYDY